MHVKGGLYMSSLSRSNYSRSSVNLFSLPRSPKLPPEIMSFGHCNNMCSRFTSVSNVQYIAQRFRGQRYMGDMETR